MYIPPAFREDNIELLHAFIQTHSFATLVTQQDGTPLANHFPFLLDTDRGSCGTLLAHMARANPQWQTFTETKEVLVIFQGPHSYVSPAWYADDVGLSVPTWNYAVVHAYGLPRLIEDSTELYKLLKASTQMHEAQFEQPWVLQLPDEYVQKKMQAIVGFEISLTRLEGKFKLSQNRSKRDQERVEAALKDSLNPDVAEFMSKCKEK